MRFLPFRDREKTSLTENGPHGMKFVVWQWATRSIDGAKPNGSARANLFRMRACSLKNIGTRNMRVITLSKNGRRPAEWRDARLRKQIAHGDE
jgi:hypothetical protein